MLIHVCILSLISLSISFTPELSFPKEDNLFIFSELTIDEGMKVFESLFIFFDSEWCGGCQSHKSKYKEIAKTFTNYSSNHDVIFGVIDTGTYMNINTRFGIAYYSKIIFVYRGKNTGIYNGNFDSMSMNLHVLEKKSNPSETLVTKKKIDSKRFNYNEVVVYFGNDSQDIQAIIQILFDYSFIQFVTCNCENDEDVMFFYKVTKPKTMVIFTTYGEMRYELVLDSNTKQSQIRQFIFNNAYPLIMQYSVRVWNMIFGDKNSGIFLIKTNNSSHMEENEKLTEQYTSLASEFKGKIFFVNVESFFDEAKEHFSARYNITESHLPIILIYDPIADDISTLSNSNDYDSMKLEIQTAINKNPTKSLYDMLEPEAKSNVHYLDTESFERIVYNPELDVLVNFFDLNSKESKKVVPVYERLASSVVHVPKIVIANIDNTLNPIPNILISSYPTFIFYPAGNIRKSLQLNRENISYENFIDFLEKNTHYKIK